MRRPHPLFPALLLAAAATLPALAQAAPILKPKAVIVVYFEVAQDTGDRPGELQLWVERDHLDRVIEVPGMNHSVRANAAGTEIAVAVGPGNVKPGINLMALGADPRFDLRESHWLINGIAGISPADGTIGAAVWTDYVVNGDLVKQIDAREIPSTWADGYLSLDGATPTDAKGTVEHWEDDVRAWTGDDAHANRRGNVIRLNQPLLQWAYRQTRAMPLPETPEMRSLRLRYKGSPATQTGPKVQIGANLTTEVFWAGARMDAWAHRWVAFETDGVAHLGTTAMNDTGALLAIEALTQQGKANWQNALLLRTASNFDQPPPGVTAAENLQAEKHGAYTAFVPALEAAYNVGHVVVAKWLQ